MCVELGNYVIIAQGTYRFLISIYQTYDELLTAREEH
jgi:hypothetical protein